ncbi:hypothetical protein BBOV_III006420 [Babesia bovis T2Bo]|uniref:Uncharacterized protein n=1 Tax=Babesia bovis TaxID=5865 RepID=A7ANR9_BABBO|nr:hypothetical protein BBOV_III006420 [Babesia bovis T2Bo]EDO08203.1 hypothetical protein BBOV_III006420 [Babesia bovis T2Bo]|eukprot:XP_001611771.1 hypothetical protein [Babesia bovis T2Bo]
MESDELIAKRNGLRRISKTPTTPKHPGLVNREFPPIKKEAPPPRFKSFHDYYLTQGKHHNRDFLTAQRAYNASLQGHVPHIPNHVVQSNTDDAPSRLSASYKCYDEKELSVVLKGHVKRLCNYFQNAVPNKQYASTIKAMVEKSKPRSLANLPRSESSCSTTNSYQPQKEMDVAEMLNNMRIPAVGIIDLAQHFAKRKSGCAMPSTEQEALEFLEHEGIAYNNAVMLMESTKRAGVVKKVFNWRSAMQAICTGDTKVETLSGSYVNREEIIRVDLPLPLDPDMCEFLRKRGFVIGKNGMPILETDDVMEFDGIKFFVMPCYDPVKDASTRQSSTVSDVSLDLKTGPILPEVSHDPDTLKVYDLKINKVTTDNDLTANDSEFDNCVPCVKRSDSFDMREDSLDAFTNHIFGYAEPHNLDKVLDDLRRLLPEECDGKEGSDDLLITDPNEQNVEGFEWFLNSPEGVHSASVKDAANLDDEPLTDVDYDVIDQFRWMKAV